MRSTKATSERLLLFKAARWLILGTALFCLASCGQVKTGDNHQVPGPVTNEIIFVVRDEALKPIPDAEIEILLEAGRPLDALPLKTDANGRAVISFESQVSPQVAPEGISDRLLDYRTIISYETEAKGFFKASGRIVFTDSWESYSRTEFADLMDRRPSDKSRRIDLILVRKETLFQAEALSDPLAPTIQAGLPQLWRAWAISGQEAVLRPVPGAWAIERRSGSPWLKASVKLLTPLPRINDPALHEIFVEEFLPLIADLADLYAPLVAGWDLTLVFNIIPGGDPHALPKEIPFRLVFSEETRRQLLLWPAGEGWLFVAAETCTVGGQPWRPLGNLAWEEREQQDVWDKLIYFFAPGPGEIPEEDEPSRKNGRPR